MDVLDGLASPDILRKGQPRVAKMVLCSNWIHGGFITYAKLCKCREEFNYNRYAVIGTNYGFLHTTSGDIATWKTASGARHAAKRYMQIQCTGETNAN